jgi:putative pyruvate formate lyase activating enzyme
VSVDLSKEPVSISVSLDRRSGRAVFSDIPEQLVKPLAESFGPSTLLAAILPGEVERNFYLNLDEADRKRARFLDLLGSGELERRATEIERAGLPSSIPYFMVAINRSDEAVFGKTGAIYFVCRKGCHFCQYRSFAERSLTPDDLADRMLALQDAGADNVHFVSPTSFTRFIVAALWRAAKRGFSLPIIHKGEGEDSLRDLELLDGLIDVYLPDAKFATQRFAPNIGLPPTYPERMKVCLKEMYRQVGVLKRRPELPASGIPLEAGGMLVRHLVMPGGVEDTREVFKILKSIDEALPLHVMVNYQPFHAAKGHPVIGRHITVREVEQIVEAGNAVGLRMVFVG